MTQISVLAIDPGITTGHALGIIDDGLMKISTGQQKYSEYELWSALHRTKPDVLIYERFEGRASIQGVELFSRNLIGVMNLYDQMTLELMCVQQMPQYAIGGYWTDVILKKVMLYKALKGGHANDACRHLLQWFTFGPGYKFNTKGYEPA